MKFAEWLHLRLMKESDLIEIDLRRVVRDKLPQKSRYIPGFVIGWLERVICQRQMNEMLRKCRGKRDADFCRCMFEHLGITYRVEGAENLPKDGRVIIVCNHPLGGLDGMMLIDYFTQIYGKGLKFIVNDLLMAIEPLRGVFLPINKHGHQSRDSFRGIDEAMSSDMPVLIFPAGLCSRKGKDGRVSDLKWQKTFVNKAIQHERTVIPVFFKGRNSNFFYNFARLRERSGLKLNIEMIRLPREMFRSAGQSFKIRIGRPIAWQTLEGGSRAQWQADCIKEIVYNLE